MHAADRVIAPADWRAEPWKNGRGVTRVIARWHREAEAPSADPSDGPDLLGSAYDVRVSLAEVTEPGPFSTFPGYRRWSILLGEHDYRDRCRVGLDDGTAIQWLERGVPFAIDGATPLVAVVPDGPVTLLNVIAKPGVVEVGQGDSSAPVDFVFALSATGELAAQHAKYFATRQPARGDVVWIAWRLPYELQLA